MWVCSPPWRGGLFVLPSAAPCPSGAGAASPGPRSGSQERLREATPTLAPCHLPVFPSGRGAPGRAGWGLGRSREQDCAARRRGLQPRLSASTPLHASPWVCSGLMPPREKPLPSLCHRISIYPHSQAGQALPFESTLNGFRQDLWNSLG